MPASRFRTIASRVDRFLSTLRYAVIGNAMVWITGCVAIPKATTPLSTIQHSWTEGEQQERLIVFLPGRADNAKDFTDKGLWSFLKEANLPFDAIAVDAHLGYYLKQNIVDRIQADIIAPAKAKGYSEIWVVGNSLGGLGALLVEKDLPGTWHTMLLLAPFLGDDKRLYKTFEQAGGVENWNPQVEFAKTDFSPRLWLWLKNWKAETATRPATFLGYGTGDRLKLGIKHLEPLLPDGHVTTTDGGHKWHVWKPLFERIMIRATERAPRARD